jgi:signal peptidase complex subunit 3
MHTAWQRFNMTTSYATTAAMVLVALLTAYSVGLNRHYQDVAFAPSQPFKLTIKDHQVVYGKRDFNHITQRNKEFLFLDMELTADLSPLFHWNTKQVLVYISVAYQNDRFSSNEVVVWNDVLQHSEDAVFKKYRISNKRYSPDHLPVFDLSRGLQDANLSVVLKWEVGPYLGVSWLSESPLHLHQPLHLTKYKSEV